ncbi:MAG TPA: 50S ribosomal protein L13 [Candidatus Peribacteraceae bacterium]|nr:50S ribosomal protein L13 [Candidatus Peribacteraceae bacterium]
MKTTTVKPEAPKWHLIDAKGETIGKVAVKAASVLRGKHKATFSPHQLCGDHVVIVNAAEVKLPPKKGLRKTYYRHTGFVGNMKIASLTHMMEKKPTFAIENAVKGMLEANRLRRDMLKRLHVYADGQHPYEAQKPAPLSVSRS